MKLFNRYKRNVSIGKFQYNADCSGIGICSAAGSLCVLLGALLLLYRAESGNALPI